MARSRSGDGDSKQGLTVALVLFVLLSIVLSLMAYFGYAEQKLLADEKNALKNENLALKRDRDREKLIRAVYQSAIGVAANRKEEKDLSDALGGLKSSKDRRDANDDTHQQAFEKELKRLKGLTWDVTAAAPDKTYVEQLTLMQKQVEAEATTRKQAQDNLEKANKDFQNSLAAAIKAKEAAEGAMANTKKEMETRIKDITDNYEKVVKEFKDNIISEEKFQTELQKLRKDKEELDGKLQAALKDAELKIRKLEEKIPQIDLLAYDKEKGRITRLEGNATAYINLGRSDVVRAGMTFSIFGVGKYMANAERKASLEVVEIIGDHLSKARVTEVRSAARDPVLTGDLLYNPAWSPGMREHVAIAGLIDLTGDGRDGTLDFVKSLEKQGVAVDAYLDTRDVSIKGKGINRLTGYLIIGEIPEFQAQEQIKEGDVRQERKIAINTEIGKLRDEAVRLGVTVVPARRFMALMGFKMPRTASSLEDWNAYTFRPGVKGGAAPDANGKNAAMKKEEMKKE